MRIAVLIAARMHSTRLPKKVLADIGGSPLLLRLIRRVKLATRPSCVVVCTSHHQDDKPIIKLAEEHDVPHVAGSERNVLERFLQALTLVDADIAVRVTGDNPLTDPFIIDELLALQEETSAEYVYTEDSPRGTRSEVITRAALEKASRWAESPESSEYMTMMFRHSEHFSQRVLHVEDPVCLRPDYRLTVDTPEDLEIVQEVYRAFDFRDDITLQEIVEFLDGRPDLLTINQNIVPKLPESWVNTNVCPR